MNGIEIKDLIVSLDGFSLKDINIELPKGTILGLIGRSGAGKTTLIKAIGHLYPYVFGDVMIGGNTISRNEVKYKRDLAIVSDKNVINPFISVRGLRNSLKSYPGYNDEFFVKSLNRFIINPDQRVGKLSYGTQKKLNIIMMMSLSPKLLVLDEPTSGVDPADKAELNEMFQEFMEDEENSIVYSTHITGDLDKIADYVALLENGRIMFCMPKDELIETHYIVKIGKEQYNDKIGWQLIGKKEGAFGIEGLTKDMSLINEFGLDFAKPNIEEIMVCYLNEYRTRSV